MKMSFWERITKIDRRIIYIILAVVIILPLILTFNLPGKVRAMPRTQNVFDHIEGIDPEGKRKALMLSVDFDPQSEPELKPQFEAVVRHAFARDIPVVVLTLNTRAPGICEEVLLRLSREHGKVNGEDYVFLGFGWPPVPVLLGMGRFIDRTFRTDYYGTPLNQLPMMDDIRNYDDVGLIITFTASTFYQTYIVYAYTPFNVPVATGVTSVSVADIYPYLGSEQLIGMLAGLKAAAEYEGLVKEKYFPDKPIFLRATQAMPALSAALIVILLFVIIGNIGFFATRRKK